MGLEFRNNPAVKKPIKLISCLPLLDTNVILQAYKDIKDALPGVVLRTLRLYRRYVFNFWLTALVLADSLYMDAELKPILEWRAFTCN